MEGQVFAQLSYGFNREQRISTVRISRVWSSENKNIAQMQELPQWMWPTVIYSPSAEQPHIAS